MIHTKVVARLFVVVLTGWLACQASAQGSVSSAGGSASTAEGPASTRGMASSTQQGEAGGAGQDAITQARNRLAARDALRGLTDPSLSSVSRLPGVQVLVGATSDEGRAEAEFGFAAGDVGPNEFLMSFKLSGPIGKSGSETKLATLEGLADQVTFTAGLRLLTPRPEIMFDRLSPVEFHAALLDACEADAECTADSDDVATTDLSPEGRRAFMRRAGLGGGLKLFTFEFTYGAPQSFSFLAQDSLEPMTEKHDGLAVAAGAGWMPLRRGFYFAAITYRYEESHEGRRSRQICAPLTIPGFSECRQVAVGAPQPRTRQLVQGEVRQYFWDGRLAVNPRLTYDFENSATGFELPFYFLKDGQGVLNGGLAVGWRSDQDDDESVTLSFFVGSLVNPLLR